MSAQEESRPGGRKPANQQRNPAGFRDGTPGSQQARRGGKAAQNVAKPQENDPATQNGPASPAPPPVLDEPSPGPTFNVAEIEKLLNAGMDPNAEVYKLPKSPTKTQATGGASISPWAPKPGQMANGKDFFLELRKQITEKLQEREREEAAKQQLEKQEGGAAKGG